MKNSLISSFSKIPREVDSQALKVSGGRDSTVWSPSGDRYLDAVSGLWNHCFGFSYQELIEAAKNAYSELPGYHCMHRGGCVSAYELADKLASIAPMPSSLVFFSNSGSEAIETAIKSVWLVNTVEGKLEKIKIISRHGAYHGVTIFANSLLGQPYAEFFGPRDPRAVFVDSPDFRQSEASQSEEDFLNKLIGDIEQEIFRAGADTIAAFVAEPIMGVGGIIIPPEKYFARLKKILGPFGIVLIGDEVICGFKRTGEFWGAQTVGMEPDIVATSKALSAGYFPLAATIYSTDFSDRLAEVSNRIGEFPHGHTTSGHPVGCRIALKVIEIMERPEFQAVYDKISAAFSRELASLARQPGVKEIRHTGLLAGFDLADDPTCGEVSKIQPGQIVDHCKRMGVILRSSGDTVLLAPPFTMTTDELGDVFGAIRNSLETMVDSAALVGV